MTDEHGNAPARQDDPELPDPRGELQNAKPDPPSGNPHKALSAAAGRPASTAQVPGEPYDASAQPQHGEADDWAEPYRRADRQIGARTGRTRAERPWPLAARSRRADEAADPARGLTTAADEVRIGLWGSPSSGKTTFLGALQHAVDDGRAIGRWNVHPVTDESRALMGQLTHHLVNERRFPPATPLGSETELRWQFIGDLAGSVFDRRRIRRRTPLPSEFVLNLVDVSGEAFGPAPETKNVARHVIDKAIDHLANAQGLIYLFDPIRDQELKDSAQYLNTTILFLSQRMLQERRLVDGFLPQHVSVCVTKFDHPKLFDKAREAMLVNAGPDGVPRVLDKDARTLFNMICDGSLWKDQSEEAQTSAWYIRDQLTKRFHPNRIRYFVTSAVGFRRAPDRDGNRVPGFGIDPRNYANVYEAGGEPRIYGPITPINVLEPLVGLYQQLTANGTARG